MEEQFEDQQFVEYVVKSLVDNPDKVRTTRTVDEMGVLITLDVDPADMGQVIGRSGQTAKSIRTLLKTVGAKNGARVNMKINEPEGGKRAPRKDDSEAAAAGATADAAQPSGSNMSQASDNMDPTGSVADELQL